MKCRVHWIEGMRYNHATNHLLYDKPFKMGIRYEENLRHYLLMEAYGIRRSHI